ncbi:MAG: HAMP domain-containing histidine kinase [Oscillospiraceae bacterium]|jgi:signal transduction histidine kinase|nr:HAMP domain-containing histidine kinase [Oscillospiraceae bacterium]
MRASIYLKNFISTAITVLLSFVLLGSLFSAWTYRTIVTDRHATLSSAVNEAERYIHAYIKPYSRELNTMEISIAMSIIAHASNINIMAADENGVVTACSDSFSCTHIGKQVPSDIISSVSFLSDPQTDSVILSGTLGGVFDENRTIAAIPLVIGSGDSEINVGYVFASVETEFLRDATYRFLKNYTILAGVVMCAAFIVSLISTKHLAAPIRELAVLSRRIGRGDFSVRSRAALRQDEIGELAGAFNQMADSLGRSDKKKSELLANVSHELRTPMTVISGFADGILDGTVPHEKQTEYLNIISSETKRLSRLVRSMLDTARFDKEQNAKKVFDITDVLATTLIGLTPKIESKHLDVEPRFPEEAVIVIADKDAITQVAYNLIDNAIKFAEEHSVLVLDVWKKDTKVFVSVENTGETIPKDELPLIFERFHKVDKSRGVNPDGAGLGLYIAKTIMDHHNESISVESENGKTRFTFTLSGAGEKPDRRIAKD